MAVRKPYFCASGRVKSLRCSLALLILVMFVAIVEALPAAAQIQVNSTNPSAAPQGTTSLNVTINGNGFKKGATAKWFVTGTTNPGGITVNSTAFNGSGSLTANITISGTATLSGFDVVVTNTDGRTGKGTDAFTVTQKGTPTGCSTTGTPGGFTLKAVLNPVQSDGTALIKTSVLGNGLQVRPLSLKQDGVVDTLVAFVTSGTVNSSVPGTYIFFLDPITGAPQATNPETGAVWQNPLLVLSGIQSRHAAAGDVNGDGIPDFAFGSNADGVAYVFVGSISGSPSYTPSYTAYAITPPSGVSVTWAQSVALGDLDGDGKDEIGVSATPNSSKQPAVPAAYIYKFTGGGMSLWEKIQDPTGSTTSDFSGGAYGGGIAIGNITGGAGNALVVGSDLAGTNGLVYVFPYPASQSNYFTITGPGPGFGGGIAISDVDLDGFPELVVNNENSKSPETVVFPYPIQAGSTYSNQLLPATGLSPGTSWAHPGFDVGNLATVGAVAVGAIDANNSNGCSVAVGALQLFTSSFAASQQPNYVFEPPTLVGSKLYEYGYAVGLVPGYPFILISEHYQDVGTTSEAGQVYVYEMN